MKKTLCLLLIFIFTFITFAGCSEKTTDITIKIVVDEGDDGIYEQIILDEELKITSDEPSIDDVIKHLSDNKKITVEYSTDEEGNAGLAVINNYEIKDELKDIEDDIYTFYYWSASINGGEDVVGLWSEAKVQDDDVIIIKYVISDIALDTN
ncbi:MAG: hypothetical protein A2Y15_00700 [Clostridiales bacterium GWF2_36_10]|nr:MAG: hypothetical protein A2Y15_00700 [Clostridiales bacterium GWF2_36_10]HAN21513.1 hypothetical protein [Clostridiales bacterium]